MTIRVTITLDDAIIKKLRAKHAAMIKKSSSSVTFSRVINETLEKTLNF